MPSVRRDETPLEETMDALTEIVRQRQGPLHRVLANDRPRTSPMRWPFPGSRSSCRASRNIRCSIADPETRGHPAVRCQRYFADRLVAPRPGSPVGQIYPRRARCPTIAARRATTMGTVDRRDWLKPGGPRGSASTQADCRWRLGCTLSQFALAWVLREPNVASAITGASRPEQVVENAGASGREVDPALFTRAEELIAAGRAS